MGPWGREGPPGEKGRMGEVGSYGPEGPKGDRVSVHVHVSKIDKQAESKADTACKYS